MVFLVRSQKKKNIFIKYEGQNQSFSCPAKIKLQGGTSLDYPKKNYNIQFFKDTTYESKQKVKLVDAWGKQSKYTLKANWIDYSQMRNVVTAKLYGDIVRSRNIDDQYSSLFNGGAVDGYPVAVFLDGRFNGLYTLNTAKDEYIFGMKGDETTKEAVLMGDIYAPSVSLNQEMSGKFDDGWELEYSSTEDNPSIGTEWIKESFNAFIRFLLNSTDEEFKEHIAEYTNVERTIDSMLLSWISSAKDNTSKNIIWTTFDGQHWVPSVYDLDSTWSLVWDGSFGYSPEAWAFYQGNKLWTRVYENYYQDIVFRYEELRSGPLSLANIDKRFIDFRNSIPTHMYEREAKRWPKSPSQDQNHVSQIVQWAKESLINFDALFGIDSPDLMPYGINFNLSNGLAVKVYTDEDYSRKGDLTTKTLSRDKDSGYVSSNEGEVNFEIVVPNKATINQVVVNGTYGALLTHSETGRNNTYRVTKISSNLVININ